MKVLVIDDSRAMRMLLGQMLLQMGFEVSEARHGREALTYLEANRDVGLALVDWNMPEMNGIEFVEAVRKDERFASLQLMMVTTETEMARVARAMEAGAQEYVMKPFTRDVLDGKLRLMGLLG